LIKVFYHDIPNNHMSFTYLTVQHVSACGCVTRSGSFLLSAEV